MSVAAHAIAEVPLAQAAPAGSAGKPPGKRTIIAKADTVQQPQAS